MKGRAFQLGGGTRGLLYGSFGLLFSTGVAWLILHYFFVENGDFGLLPSPYEPLLLMLHGLVVPIFTAVVGALFPTHISRAFKARKNRPSGICLLSAVFGLFVTGYLLYYSGGAATRQVSSVIHSAVGIAIALLLALHVYVGRRISTKNASRIA